MSDGINDIFFPALEKALKRLDGESPFGLRGYADHLLGTRKRIQDEEPISRGLCKCLFDAGLPAFAEVLYPIRNSVGAITDKFCDLVVRLRNDEFLWIEAKVFFTEYYKDITYAELFKSKNLTSKIGSFLNDCKIKTASLTRPEATYVGGLLIGFESSSRPVPAKQVTRVNSEMSEWNPGHRESTGVRWQSSAPAYTGELQFWNRVWFWSRAVA